MTTIGSVMLGFGLAAIIGFVTTRQQCIVVPKGIHKDPDDGKCYRFSYK